MVHAGWYGRTVLVGALTVKLTVIQVMIRIVTLSGGGGMTGGVEC